MTTAKDYATIAAEAYFADPLSRNPPAPVGHEFSAGDGQPCFRSLRRRRTRRRVFKGLPWARLTARQLHLLHPWATARSPGSSGAEG